MSDRPEWRPSGQACYPPELPPYLKSVHDLKPVVGVPRDEELIEIHAVVHAAHRASGIPGMHDPCLLMKVADHLFSVQMARYRSKYSFTESPSSVTYTPPTLPAHVPINLEPVSDAPSDDQIIKVQDAMRNYQQLVSVPSMFDPRVNMELSQHLFSIQMAKYIRATGGSITNPEHRETPVADNPTQTMEQVSHPVQETNSPKINATTSENIRESQTPQSIPGTDVRELIERSNQLTERFNQLLERSNRMTEQSTQPTTLPSSLMELFKYAIEQFTEFAHPSHGSMEYSSPLAERFNHLFERFNEMIRLFNQPTQLEPTQVVNQLTEQSNRILERSNQLAERQNQLLERLQPALRLEESSERGNQLTERLAESSERSNQLADQANKHSERLGDVMKNINRVLVGIQHATVRNRQGNTERAVYCLVNEAGDALGVSETGQGISFRRLFGQSSTSGDTNIPLRVDGVVRNLHARQPGLGECLRFFGIGDGLCVSEMNTELKEGKQEAAINRLSDYLTSCLV